MPSFRSGSSEIGRFHTVPELRRLLRRREVSAVELAGSALRALGGVGRRYHAVAELTEVRALREARSADRALRAGTGGALCGIPYGVKDLLDTGGIPTRWGSSVYRSRIPETDATTVRRMRDAGAVLVAKLALVELAGGGSYRSAGASAEGACMNPWDPTRWTGGSSSGSAAAVAMGIIPVALGSETGGSLVLPAAFCGISTIRPSFGAVSRHGAMTLAWSMDKIGPLARTAADCALVLGAIAGHDPLDPTTLDAPLSAGPFGRLRVGVIEDATSNATVHAFDESLRVLRRLGLRLRSVRLPAHDYRTPYLAIMSAETAEAHEALITSPALDRLTDPAQREGFRATLRVTAIEYARALRARARIQEDLHALFGDVDVLVAPTMLTEAAPLASDVVADRKRRGGHAVLGALAGVPAVSVPMGFGPSGLPVGLEFTGDHLADRMLLRVAGAYQRETGWHLARPPFS